MTLTSFKSAIFSSETYTSFEGLFIKSCLILNLPTLDACFWICADAIEKITGIVTAAIWDIAEILASDLTFIAFRALLKSRLNNVPKARVPATSACVASSAFSA